MRAPTRLLTALAASLAGAVLLAGCGGSDPEEPEAEVTSIADLDASTMTLARIGFCDLVPAAAVREALGGDSSAQEEWGNGDVPPMDGAGADVTHEFGCAWSRGGDSARAWVFARPVTAAFGRQVIAEARSRKACTTKRAPTFGKPGLIQTCTVGKGRTRVRNAGLFGDTWLTCEVAAADPATVSARADAWCAAIAGTLDKR